MHLKRAILVAALIAATAAACEPTPIPLPTALPSPTREWKLKLTQSGGFAGVMRMLDVDSNGNLHAEDVRSGRSLSSQVPPGAVGDLGLLVARLENAPATPVPSACADCFIYDLELTTSGGTVRFHADDMTLAASSAGDLITYLRQLLDKALAA